MKLRKKISVLLVSVMLVFAFCYSIPAYAATDITEVRISYEEINVGDSIADAASKFTVAASENYTITDVKVYFMDSQSERLESGTFEKDKVYAFVIVITPKNNNYVFPKDKYNDYAGNVYMNEYFNYRNYLDDDNTLYVSYDFAAGKKNVKEINLIFDEPVVGKTPAAKTSYTTVPENAYTGDLYLEWFCSSDGNWEESVLMSETDVFEPGKYYYVIWYEKDGEFEINDGFYDYNSVVKINGTMIKMNYDYGYMYTPDEVHNLTKVPAKAATDTVAGNSEYYTCSTCGKYFSDDAAKNEIAKDSWVIPAKNAVSKTTYVTMFRLYNPNSGEHFYTASEKEKNNLVTVGWRYEGIAWNAPKTSNTPVYRLYNPNAGDHHYTTSAAEKDNLVKVGWKYEGIGWYSTAKDGKPLYRLYNPNAKAGAHHYTTSAAERDNLKKLGWRDEGIAWYGGK